jgi:hypothetical protein
MTHLKAWKPRVRAEACLLLPGTRGPGSGMRLPC